MINKKTLLFFFNAALLQLSYFLTFYKNYYNLPNLLICILIYFTFLAFIILNFKEIKIRFLTYPMTAYFLSMGILLFSSIIIDNSNNFILWLLRMVFVFAAFFINILVLILGITLDVIEIRNKNKCK